MLHNYNIPEGTWDFDDNGFLRIPIRLLKTGCMVYGAEELGSVPTPHQPSYTLMVAQDAMSDPESLRSLEGMPVTAWNHQWTGPEEQGWVQVGTIAGAPRMDGPYLCVDLVIMDPSTIDDVVNRRLVDISSAYNFQPVWGKGTYDGLEYDGGQTHIRYNHVTLLPPGEGRAGRDVRIMNSKQEIVAVEKAIIAYRLPTGETIRVVNSDVNTLSRYLTEADTIRAKNAEGGASLEQALAELERLNAEMAALQGEKDKYMGEVTALKEKIDSILSPENLEAEATAMLEERDDAGAVMESVTPPEEKEAAFNSLKGLRGHDLKLHVVKAVRAANKATELTADQAKSEGFVGGLFASYQETAKAMNSGKGPGARQSAGRVVGAVVVKAKNSGNRKSAHEKLGFKKEA
jgi:hypothetical protein